MRGVSVATSALERPIEVPLFLLLLFVAAMQSVYPRLPWQTDEANYLATAYKMQRTHRLSAAVHDPVDILRTGLDHKHVKMPAYLVVLAGWLAVFPSPDSVRLLNEVFFGAAVLGLWSFSQRRPWRLNLPTILGGAVLFAVPMGIAYAATAMMESFVLAVAVLHFAGWYALRRKVCRIEWFYATAFLALITKESLLFLTAGMVLAAPRSFYRLHVQHWKRNRFRFAMLVMAIVAGTLAGISLLRNRGYHPSFRNRLMQTEGLHEKLTLIQQNLHTNLGCFFRWDDFPHDYFYSYTLACVALTLSLAVLWRRRSTGRMARALTIAWAITIVLVCALYDNIGWRSHRIYHVLIVLSLAVVIRGILRSLEQPRRRLICVGLLGAMLLINLWFAFQMNRYMIRVRGPFITQQHVLTRRKLPREGDCLLNSISSFHFLIENLRCEIIWRVPDDDARLRAVLRRARPRFVILPENRSIEDCGYRKIDRYYDDIVWIRRGHSVDDAIPSNLSYSQPR